MNELNKRIITSFFLLTLMFFSFLSLKLLIILILLINLISLFEFNSILNKIFKNKNFLYFFSFLLAVMYITYFSIVVVFFLIDSFHVSKFVILFILVICIATDIGGFIFGKIIGGKKLTDISPNKTYSGLLGSFLSSLLIGYLFYEIQFEYLITNLNIILLIIIISMFSQIGDLIISLFKRKAMIKDTGTILPGHGGILDRIDGMLLALPIGIILINIYS